MSFKSYLKPKVDMQEVQEKFAYKKLYKEGDVINNIKLEESVKTPEELLRKAGFKIKLVAPTKFGTQIDFAKKYEEEKIKEVLSDFNVKFDNKSIFVVD